MVVGVDSIVALMGMCIAASMAIWIAVSTGCTATVILYIKMRKSGMCNMNPGKAVLYIENT